MISLRCACGHSGTHQHYRWGSDCSVCGCGQWRWRWTHPRAWREQRRKDRTFRALVEISEDLGLYDANPADVAAALREARGKTTREADS